MWSDGHWAAQQEALEKRMAALGEEFGRELARAYGEAQGEVQAMLRDFYGRYGEDDVMTLAQARRMEADGQTRLRALERKIGRQVDSLHSQYESGLRDVLGKIYALGHEQQLEALKQGAQKEAPAGAARGMSPEQALAQPWAGDGRTFDERIGQDARQMKGALAREVEQGLARGDDAEQIAQRVAKEMGIAQSAAMRLVRTECSAIGSRASLEAYKECGVEKFKFVATLDAGTCSVCGGLNGQVFLVEDFEVGVNAPPMHPNDRCTTAPYFGELKGQGGDGMMEEDEKTGTIWDDVKATQPAEAGNSIPKSFELKTPNGDFWVNPNATKHMIKYANRGFSHGLKMTEQELLTSFGAAVNKAAQKGYANDEAVLIDNWHLVFSSAREAGLLPVVKHALYRP